MKSLIAFLFIALTSLASAQETDGGAVRQVDIDLTQFCRDPEAPVPAEASLVKAQKRLTCERIAELERMNFAPISLIKNDENGDAWKIRFFFGFTRANYLKTDLHVKTNTMSVVIRDVEMDERILPHSLRTGKERIDEPMNTFSFSVEKERDIFYLTVSHPKYVKTLAYAGTRFTPIAERDRVLGPVPANSNVLFLDNTRRSLTWQIGYGREFVLSGRNKRGDLSYIPRSDVGLATGIGISGVSASLGHRLEYRKGKVCLFVDQKMTYSKMKYESADGRIEYDLTSMPTTFGVGIDLFSKRKKNSRGIPH